MSEPESTLANAVLSRNLKVKKGESVVIEAWTHALPYVRAFVREARRLGAHPTVLYEEEDAWWDAVKSKQLGSFQKLSAAERETIASADVFLGLRGTLGPPPDVGASRVDGGQGDRRQRGVVQGGPEGRAEGMPDVVGHGFDPQRPLLRAGRGRPGAPARRRFLKTWR